MRFEEKVNQFITSHSLLRSGEHVVVGLSGGADSVALLRVLQALGFSCVAAHCNFRLRGSEADGDQAFSASLCETLGVPFHSVSFDTRTFAAQNGVSIEMAARQLRYDYFERLRRETGAAHIAVAHHRDDSVETVMLNLIRGTGIHGLCGIRPRVGYVVRPLLGVSRSDVVDYLQRLGQTYVTDSTNLEPLYKRNRVRLELLPQLRRMNPSFDDAILRMTRIMSDAADYLDASVGDVLSRLLSPSSDGEELSVEALRAIPGACSVLYAWLHPYGFERAVVEQIYARLDSDPGARYVGPSHTVWRDRGCLVLCPNASSDASASYSLHADVPLSLPHGAALECCLIPPEAPSRDPYVATLDADKLHFPLTVRHPRQGDRFVPFGMRGSKLLSDYLTDRKVSLYRRAGLWLVCSGTDIVWVVGERIDGRYAVGRHTRRVARLEYKQSEI